MNKLGSSVLHLAAAAAIATSGDSMANANNTTARVIDTKSPDYVNVTETTRKRIADLQKNFPQFKIDDEVLSCIKGNLIVTECEPTVVAVADAGENMIKIEAKRRELEVTREKLIQKDKALDEKDKALDEKDKALDEKDKALTKESEALKKESEALKKIKIIWDDITITTWLIQLGLYVGYNQIPSSEADAMNKVISNKNTPEEVLKLFREYFNHKKNGGVFTWKTHGERLISLANKYLTKAMELESSIQNPDIKKDATDLIKLTVKFYDTNVKMLNKQDNTIIVVIK